MRLQIPAKGSGILEITVPESHDTLAGIMSKATDPSTNMSARAMVVPASRGSCHCQVSRRRAMQALFCERSEGIRGERPRYRLIYRGRPLAVDTESIMFASVGEGAAREGMSSAVE